MGIFTQSIKEHVKDIWAFMWTDHGQKTLGFLQITVGVFAVWQGLPKAVADWFILINGLLMAGKGFFGNPGNSGEK